MNCGEFPNLHHPRMHQGANSPIQGQRWVIQEHELRRKHQGCTQFTTHKAQRRAHLLVAGPWRSRLGGRLLYPVRKFTNLGKPSCKRQFLVFSLAFIWGMNGYRRKTKSKCQAGRIQIFEQEIQISFSHVQGIAVGNSSRSVWIFQVMWVASSLEWF